MAFLRFLTIVIFCLVSSTHPQTKAGSQPSRRRETAETVYHNPAFGFSYSIPYGWVDRTKEMQGGDDAAKGEVLLAVFARPPQAAGETVNSAVVIAAEALSAYPGLKKAEDYLDPLSELMTSKGFKSEGDPSELLIDQRRLIRADFSRSVTDKVTMHQATLVCLSKARAVSFTFVAGSEDEVDDLMSALHFDAARLQR